MSNESDKQDIAEIDCQEAFDNLYAYLHGELHDTKLASELEHHIGHCRSCYSRAQMERELNERMKREGQDQAPPSLQRRLRDLLRDF